MERKFNPMVIQTKEEMLMALKNGKIKSSRYNALSEEERIFVELVVFGDYTAERAIRVMQPHNTRPKLAANRMLANPEVAAVMEEFSVQRNRKFMAEVSAARDQALSKLRYIMNTTNDEAVAAACAKTILDKAEKAVVKEREQDDRVDGVRFSIEVANIYNQPQNKYNPEDKIVVRSEEVIDVEPEVPQEPYRLFYEGVDNYTKKD